jgi:hypothetical protein
MREIRSDAESVAELRAERKAVTFAMRSSSTRQMGWVVAPSRGAFNAGAEDFNHWRVQDHQFYSASID